MRYRFPTNLTKADFSTHLCSVCTALTMLGKDHWGLLRGPQLVSLGSSGACMHGREGGGLFDSLEGPSWSQLVRSSLGRRGVVPVPPPRPNLRGWMARNNEDDDTCMTTLKASKSYLAA